jgi:hypothetical protein
MSESTHSGRSMGMSEPMETETAFMMLVAITASRNSHRVLIFPVRSITIRKVRSNSSLKKTIRKDWVRPRRKELSHGITGSKRG